MPKKPTFRHFTDVPFDISWNDMADLWELDLPADMPPLGLPVVLSDRYVPGREVFYFGSGKLKEVCGILQDHLDSLRVKISEHVEDLPEYEILHVDNRHFQVLGPDLATISDRLRLSPTLLSNGVLQLKGETAERKLSVLREYLMEMSRHRTPSKLEIEGLEPKRFQRGLIGHIQLRGPLVEPLAKVLAGTGIRYTADVFGTLVLENKDLPAVAALAETLRETAKSRLAEIKAAISEPEFDRKLPSWAKLRIEDDALCLVYPADFLRANVRLGLKNRGFTGPLWGKDKSDPGYTHWAIDIDGSSPTSRLLSSVLSAIRFLETKRREEAKRKAPLDQAGSGDLVQSGSNAAGNRAE